MFLMAVLFWACGKTESLPLGEDTLVEVLVDVHTAEAAMSGLTAIERDTLAHRFYQDIFLLHQVSQTDFDTSMAILLRNPERFGEIYEKVEAKLDAKLAGQGALPENEAEE
jgi:hypothetical protein